jgi:hypothetical protein
MELLNYLNEAIVLAAVVWGFAVERAVEYFIAYVMEKKLPDTDRNWLRYVVLILAGAGSWFSGWSIFSDAAQLHPFVAQLATAVLVGAGPEMIHRLVKEPKAPKRE